MPRVWRQTAALRAIDAPEGSRALTPLLCALWCSAAEERLLYSAPPATRRHANTTVRVSTRRACRGQDELSEHAGYCSSQIWREARHIWPLVPHHSGPCARRTMNAAPLLCRPARRVAAARLSCRGAAPVDAPSALRWHSGTVARHPWSSSRTAAPAAADTAVGCASHVRTRRASSAADKGVGARPLAQPAFLQLDGKTALVTGGARGLGRGIALELARCGAGKWAARFGSRALAPSCPLATCTARAGESYLTPRLRLARHAFYQRQSHSRTCLTQGLR